MAKLIQYPCADSLYDGPFDSSSGWRAAGMGYVILTEHRRLIVIDGGNSNDGAGLLSLLQKLSGEEKPRVDLWFITHPHGDHYYVLRTIADDPALAGSLSIERLIFHFPEKFNASASKPSVCTALNKEMQQIASVFNAEIHTPRRDEQFQVDDVDVRVLYTPDDCSIFRTASLNVLSLILRVQGSHHRAVFTGDAVYQSMEITRWRYPSAELHAEYLQMPHHGLCDVGCLSFYRAVNARQILHPSCIAGDRAMASEEYRQSPFAVENRWALENAEKVHYSYTGLIKLEL